MPDGCERERWGWRVYVLLQAVESERDNRERERREATRRGLPSPPAFSVRQSNNQVRT